MLDSILNGNRVDKITSIILNSTLVVSRPAPPTVEALGSGLLLMIDDDLFLLTAGHLLNLEDWPTLLIPGNETKIIYLNGTIATTFKNKDFDSNIDFAVLKFSERMKKHLLGGDYQFLKPNQIRINHQVIYGESIARYVIAGHPVNSVKKIVGTRNYRLNPLKILTTPIAKKKYEKHGFNPEHHILVRYQRSLAPIGSIFKRTTVEAEGISGSGLWFVPEWNSQGEDAPIFYLVGIMIENFKDYGFMVALKIDFICETIREVFQKEYLHASKIDVGAAIEQVYCAEK